VARKQVVQPFFDARGRLLIERRGLQAPSLTNDAYHFLRTASWSRIVLLFLALFLGINMCFALVMWFGGAKIANASGFADYYWFSVQTFGTIGYGGLMPADTLANAVVTVESFSGMAFTALATGIFFARFATTSARIIFSRVAVIHEFDGKPMLMFRMANARSTMIVEATVRMYLSRDEVLASGERLRRIYDLELRRNVSPTFALSWTVYHVLDETSPLHGLTASSLASSSATLIVTFQGIDDRLASTIHTRYTYDSSDLVFDRRFVDIIRFDPDTGVRYLDLDQLHDTEPLPARPA
jgi:inward rectifier potassium channel